MPTLEEASARSAARVGSGNVYNQFSSGSSGMSGTSEPTSSQSYIGSPVKTEEAQYKLGDRYYTAEQIESMPAPQPRLTQAEAAAGISSLPTFGEKYIVVETADKEYVRVPERMWTGGMQAQAAETGRVFGTRATGEEILLWNNYVDSLVRTSKAPYRPTIGAPSVEIGAFTHTGSGQRTTSVDDNNESLKWKARVADINRNFSQSNYSPQVNRYEELRTEAELKEASEFPVWLLESRKPITSTAVNLTMPTKEIDITEQFGGQRTLSTLVTPDIPISLSEDVLKQKYLLSQQNPVEAFGSHIKTSLLSWDNPFGLGTVYDIGAGLVSGQSPEQIRDVLLTHQAEELIAVDKAPWYETALLSPVASLPMLFFGGAGIGAGAAYATKNVADAAELLSSPWLQRAFKVGSGMLIAATTVPPILSGDYKKAFTSGITTLALIPIAQEGARLGAEVGFKIPKPKLYWEVESIGGKEVPVSGYWKRIPSDSARFDIDNPRFTTEDLYWNKATMREIIPSKTIKKALVLEFSKVKPEFDVRELYTDVETVRRGLTRDGLQYELVKKNVDALEYRTSNPPKPMSDTIQFRYGVNKIIYAKNGVAMQTEIGNAEYNMLTAETKFDKLGRVSRLFLGDTGLESAGMQRTRIIGLSGIYDEASLSAELENQLITKPITKTITAAKTPAITTVTKHIDVLKMPLLPVVKADIYQTFPNGARYDIESKTYTPFTIVKPVGKPVSVQGGISLLNTKWDLDTVFSSFGVVKPDNTQVSSSGWDSQNLVPAEAANQQYYTNAPPSVELDLSIRPDLTFRPAKGIQTATWNNLDILSGSATGFMNEERRRQENERRQEQETNRILILVQQPAMENKQERRPLSEVKQRQKQQQKQQQKQGVATILGSPARQFTTETPLFNIQLPSESGRTKFDMSSRRLPSWRPAKRGTGNFLITPKADWLTVTQYESTTGKKAVHPASTRITRQKYMTLLESPRASIMRFGLAKWNKKRRILL